MSIPYPKLWMALLNHMATFCYWIVHSTQDNVVYLSCSMLILSWNNMKHYNWKREMRYQWFCCGIKYGQGKSLYPWHCHTKIQNTRCGKQLINRLILFNLMILQNIYFSTIKKPFSKVCLTGGQRVKTKCLAPMKRFCSPNGLCHFIGYNNFSSTHLSH